MEKPNVVVTDKKTTSSLFLPTCSKVFECIIYNTTFPYFTENSLTSKNQSGFRPAGSCVICDLLSKNQSRFKFAGSCVNQLLAITH